MYTGCMINFVKTEDGYVFSQDTNEIAIGSYDNGNFCLIFNDDIVTFSNAMQAYCHLRSTLEPGVAKPETLELINTPARAIDNLSKYRYNEILKDVTCEVFHATLCN